MGKIKISTKQPAFKRTYELSWSCPECGHEVAEEEPGTTVNAGDVFQCPFCDIAFTITKKPAKKAKARQ